MHTHTHTHAEILCIHLTPFSSINTHAVTWCLFFSSVLNFPHFCFIVCVWNSAGHVGLRHGVVKREGAVWQQQRLWRQPGQWKRRPQPATGSPQLLQFHTVGFFHDSSHYSRSCSVHAAKRRRKGQKWNILLASVKSCKGSVSPPTVVISDGLHSSLTPAAADRMPTHHYSVALVPAHKYTHTHTHTHTHTEPGE